MRTRRAALRPRRSRSRPCRARAIGCGDDRHRLRRAARRRIGSARATRRRVASAAPDPNTASAPATSATEATASSQGKSRGTGRTRRRRTPPRIRGQSSRGGSGTARSSPIALAPPARQTDSLARHRSRCQRCSAAALAERLTRPRPLNRDVVLDDEVRPHRLHQAARARRARRSARRGAQRRVGARRQRDGATVEARQDFRGRIEAELAELVDASSHVQWREHAG